MIASKLVALRAIERDDLEALLRWRNQPGMRRHFREYRELGHDHQVRWYEETVLADMRTRMFAIVRLDDSRLLGCCGLCYIDWVNRSADLSLYIGHDDLYIDETYAPDAARLLIRYGFDELGLNRIWTEIYSFDTSKQRLLLDLGFTLEGRHRHTHWAEGAWHDSLFFGLLSDETEDRTIAGDDHAG